jgi:hypothetical protein
MNKQLRWLNSPRIFFALLPYSWRGENAKNREPADIAPTIVPISAGRSRSVRELLRSVSVSLF